MTLELVRAWTPDDLTEGSCAVCKQPFVAESVLALSDRGDSACPTCVEYLGSRNPEEFPTIEQYERAKLYYPHPIWGDATDLEDLDPYWVLTNELCGIEIEEV